MDLTTLALVVRGLRTVVGNHTRQLRDLTKANQAQTDAIVAINGKLKRAGTTVGPLAIGNTDVTITWDTPWPDTAYGVWIELISGGAALGTLHATLKVGSKTTTDCVVTVNATVAVASVGVDTVGIRT